jgi:glycogen operon protein
MSLADVTAYAHKHNEANGEDNRDGHNENLSWNNGVEGTTDDPAVLAARGRDLRALLATLFLSRGTIMLTAGDEFGRTQRGNNNAYAQDNGLAWLDWETRDREIEGHAAALAAVRRTVASLRETRFLSGTAGEGETVPDVAWCDAAGRPLDEGQWNDPGNRRLTMLLAGSGDVRRVALAVNGDRRQTVFTLPAAEGCAWELAVPAPGAGFDSHDHALVLPGRTAAVLIERATTTSDPTGA